MQSRIVSILLPLMINIDVDSIKCRRWVALLHLKKG